jgi:predicted TIM-barrel fold metal-dependent hydrolase
MQTPWGEAAVADAHVHFFTRKFLGALGSQCGRTAEQVAEAAGWDLPPQDAAALAAIWAAELDRNGVERAALIASVPGDENSVRAAVTAFPERFYAYAMVNPVAGERASVAGLHALCLFPAMHRYAIADPCVEALLEEAARQPEGRRPAIFVHCGVLTVGIRRKLGLASPFDMRFSNPIDLHPVALRYPQLNFVAPHFGAGYFREALMLTDLCPNVYLDTSSSNGWMRYEGLDLKTVLRRALDVAGPRRLLFGTDSSFFPRGWNREIYDAQVNAMRDIDLGASEARLVLGENLARILG